MDAIGAKISLTTNGVTQLRQVLAGGSVFSSNPTTQHFGLAQNNIVESMTITWPDGSTQMFNNFAVNRYLTIVKGQPSGVEPPQIIPMLSSLSFLLFILTLLYITYLRFKKYRRINC